MMRCFLPCFGASKRPKHLRSAIATPSGVGHTHVAEGALEPAIQLTRQKTVEEPIDCITESKLKAEDQSNNSAQVTASTKELIENFKGSREEQEKAARKEETPQIGDRDKNEEEEEDDEVNKRLLQEESSESLFSLSIDSRKQVSAAEKTEAEVNSPMQLPGAVCTRKVESEAFGSSPSVPEKVPHVSSGLSLLKNEEEEEEEDDEVNKRLLQEESSESLFSLPIDSRKQVSAAEKAEAEVNSPMQLPGAVCTRKVESEAFGSSPSVPEKVQHVSSGLSLLENLARGKENAKLLVIKKLEEQPNCMAITNVNPNEESCAKENKEEKGKARPSNHPGYRYRDCSGEGYEDSNLDESDFDVTLEDDGVDFNRTWIQEESSESLFSLSTDSRKRISSAEIAENEVESVIPARVTASITEEETQGRILDVSSVLNPIENLTQGGRVVKATVLRPLKNEKENINLAVQDVDIPIISPEPSLKLSDRQARQKLNDRKQEIGVDTSLSRWLVPEASPTNSVGEHSSPLSHEDRPILGALTIEEIRKYSVSTSSRRSRSRSPDETPIIGTVGSYWSHTGQSQDSVKSEKDTNLKWNSTTLKTRLETAFEASATEV